VSTRQNGKQSLLDHAFLPENDLAHFLADERNIDQRLFSSSNNRRFIHWLACYVHRTHFQFSAHLRIWCARIDDRFGGVVLPQLIL